MDKTEQNERLKSAFPKELKKYREQNDVSNEYLAEKLHITVKEYNAIENGESVVQAETLLRFLSLLKDEETLIFVKAMRPLLLQQ